MYEDSTDHMTFTYGSHDATLHIMYMEYIACTNDVTMCRVYNVSSFVDHHPGGLDQILYGAGRDITTLFESYHPFSAYK